MSLPKAELGVFGGSGFYSFLDGVTEHAVTTPYGDPSDKVAIGEVEGRAGAFLPPPRPPAPVPAAQDQLPRQPVGHEGTRREPRGRPVRGRVAAGRGRA